MFKWYGLLGIFMIIFVEINFILKIQPLNLLAFPIVWLGYIFTIDAIVYRIRGNSLVSSRFNQFLGMFVISAVIWWVFGFVNVYLQNWSYLGLEQIGKWDNLLATISFSTVVPALFETTELFMSVSLFGNKKFHKKRRITKKFLHVTILIGIVCFVAPILLPKFTYPLLWVSFFLLLDPINYMRRQPSIMGHLKDRRLSI